MTVQTLTTFFGWMTVLNMGCLALAAITLIFLNDWASDIHRRMFKMTDHDIQLAYIQWLGNYKIFTLIFSLVPYLALRLI